MQLDISPEERDLLVDILSAYHATVCAQMLRREGFAQKDDLQEEAELLDRILRRLSEGKPPGSTVQAA
jgi:hypothetical protein